MEIEFKLTTNEAELDKCADLTFHSEPFSRLKFTADVCRQIVRGDNKEVYIAYADGIFAGFVVLQLSGVLRGYIQTLCLEPQFRNKGIGTKLLQFCIDRIHKISPHVFICVTSFNHDAMRLYKRMGFEQVGILKDHLVKGADECLLRRSLGPHFEWQN